MRVEYVSKTNTSDWYILLPLNEVTYTMGRSSSGALTGISARLYERNKKIGGLLAEARQQRGLTITACAEYIATTPRRYRAIERGDAPVHAAELEALLEVLHLSECPLGWTAHSGNQLDQEHRESPRHIEVPSPDRTPTPSEP